MTETEKKALALVNEVRVEYGYTVPITYDWFNADSFEHLAFLRAIEQHEAFKREVSDVCESLLACTNANKRYGASLVLNRFIIAKPDPLVDAMLGAWPQYADRMDACNSDANALRAALAARGLEIREKQQ